MRDIKEKVCFLSEDFAQDSVKADHSTEFLKDYALPDGKSLSLGAERFKACEMLFNPSLAGVERFGVHTTAYHAVMKCEPDVRKDLYSNIVLAGGCSLVPGFDQRMRREMAALLPPNVFLKIVAPPERRHSAWIGGSILSSLSTFEQMCISKKEYDDSGPSIVHRKCF